MMGRHHSREGFGRDGLRDSPSLTGTGTNSFVTLPSVVLINRTWPSSPAAATLCRRG